MKVDVYRCDRCKQYTEEENTTHAITTLRGARTGRYLEDLCPTCVEKFISTSDAEAARSALPTVYSRKRAGKRTPEEIAECLQTGKTLLEEGKDVDAVAAHFGIQPTTWYRWKIRADAARSSDAE